MDGLPSEASFRPSLAVNGLEIFLHADDYPLLLFCRFQECRVVVDEFPRVIMVDDKDHVAVGGR